MAGLCRTPLRVAALFLGALGWGACVEPSNHGSVAPEFQQAQNEAGSGASLSDDPGLVFSLWSCTALACLDLVSLETTEHAYTACAEVMGEAQRVGLGICERAGGGQVVATPATCVPLGSRCPNLSPSGAYRWDSEPRPRDAGTDARPGDASLGESDASVATDATTEASSGTDGAP